MSKVYSFRLSDKNPRETQAGEVIDAWVNEGYSLRHIITEALLQNLNKDSYQNEVYSLLEEIKKRISELERTTIFVDNIGTDMPELHIDFIDAVKRSAKSGLKSE